MGVCGEHEAFIFRHSGPLKALGYYVVAPGIDQYIYERWSDPFKWIVWLCWLDFTPLCLNLLNNLVNSSSDSLIFNGL